MTDLHGYLLEKVLDDAQDGPSIIPSSVCDSLAQRPTIDKLRKRVDVEHFTSIQHLCEGGKASHRKLGLALLRGIDEKDMVRNYVKEWVNQPDLSFETRIGLIFELAQFGKLDDSFRRESFDFIQENWEKWAESQRNWAGEKNSVLEFCKQRLGSDEIPSNKRWLYLCATAASDQTDEAKDLISGHLEDPDPFVRDVAEEVMMRL